MGKRVLFVCVIVLASLLLAACGGDDEKDSSDSSDMVTVGIMHLGASHTQTVAGFKAGMAEHGYVEGENITYVGDGPVASVEELASAADNLIEAKVDLIFCATTPAAQAAKRAAGPSQTPVVFAPLLNPVEIGLIDSISSPGGYVTGVYSGLNEEFRLQAATMLVPDAKNYLIVYFPDDQTSLDALIKAQSAAAQLDVNLVLQELQSEEELMQALDTISEDIDVFYMIPGSLVGAHFNELLAATAQRNLPLMVPTIAFVENGGLMSYGPIPDDVGQQAARLADQILKGTPAGEIPAENAEYYLAVNLATAQTLGFEVSDEFLRQADIVFYPDAE